MKRETIESIFHAELASFETVKQNTGYMEFTVSVMEMLPDYFAIPNEDGSDNGVVSHTKASVAFANTLFGLEGFSAVFGACERDSIRSALLLHDGMFFGTKGGSKANPDHPELMATFLENEKWTQELPEFMRSDIISAVRNHSGRPSSDIDRFVHMCVYLASRKETTVRLPGVEAYYRRAFGQKPSLDFDTAVSIVQQMTGGCRWDGQVYVENNTRFVVLDGQRVCVADELHDAFLVVGQARAASLSNPDYVQPAQQPQFQGETLLSVNEFFQRYQDWNGYVYGVPGQLYICSNGYNVPISDAQALELGAKIS